MFCITLFNLNNAKLPCGILANSNVERRISLLVPLVVSDRPSNGLKYFVQLGIGRMENLWEFRLSSGFPVPNWPFAVVPLHGRLNHRERKDSFAVKTDSLGKESLLC